MHVLVESLIFSLAVPTGAILGTNLFAIFHFDMCIIVIDYFSAILQKKKPTSNSNKKKIKHKKKGIQIF